MLQVMTRKHWFRQWLGTVRQHAIPWTNVYPDLCCHMVSLGHNELTHWGREKVAAVSQTTLSKRISLNEIVRISIKVSLKFVPKGPFNNNPALVQIMAWRRSGNKPLSESMKVSLLTHICVTRPQWIKNFCCQRGSPGFNEVFYTTIIHNSYKSSNYHLQ